MTPKTLTFKNNPIEAQENYQGYGENSIDGALAQAKFIIQELI